MQSFCLGPVSPYAVILSGSCFSICSHSVRVLFLHMQSFCPGPVSQHMQSFCPGPVSPYAVILSGSCFSICSHSVRVLFLHMQSFCPGPVSPYAVILSRSCVLMFSVCISCASIWSGNLLVFFNLFDYFPRFRAIEKHMYNIAVEQSYFGVSMYLTSKFE